MDRVTAAIETELQQDCGLDDLTRGYFAVCALLRGLRIDFDEILEGQLEKRNIPLSGKEVFRVLELFSGSGLAIEQIAQRVLAKERWVPESAFHMIGIDEQPLPGLIPDEVLDIDRQGFAKLINHDLTLGIPLASNSVDVCFGVEGVNYIPDVLSLLTEVHRVLRPGGIGVFRAAPWFVAEPLETGGKKRCYMCESTKLREFHRILDETPFGRDTFQLCLPESDKLGAGIIVQKDPDKAFAGFPFEVDQVFTGEELCVAATIERSPLLRHCRSASYRKV